MTDQNSASTSDYAYLSKHREVWRAKPILRRLYHEQFYRRLLDNRAPGLRTLEIGSGPGFLQDIDPAVWRTDILPSPWIHCVVDAHHLPVAGRSIDNIIGLDVLHHFQYPVKFLKEVIRVLRPGGRLVLVEPWITPFSRFVYTYLHQEGCDLGVKPWLEEGSAFAAHKLAFDGNAAIPYLLLTRGQQTLNTEVPALKLMRVETFSLFTYLLSLGFKTASLLPSAAYKPLYGLENATRPIWQRMAALRALIIWEVSQ